MENNRLYLLIAIIGITFSSSKGLNNSYNLHTSSGKEIAWRSDRHNEHRWKQNHPLSQAGNSQGMYYNIVRKGTVASESRHEINLHPHGPINVTANGKTCILFRVKRIMIKLKNQTALDLTDKNSHLYNTVDFAESNCSEDNATLSLKFYNTGSIQGLTLRILLIKSSVQNWFKLQSVQILCNNSVQATFNATRIFAPISYSYHCLHVSSLQKYDALLVPSSADDSSRQWDVTFLDFQIQGFNVGEGQFAYAKDCTTFFSPAILMGLVMSLILLLVLAYALHMLIHLKSIDRHYQRKSSTTYFLQTKDNSLEDELEPLRGNPHESYELKQQQYCRLHMQQCASVTH
ncbi:V-type proton ATPase subunit S1-like protein isoform 1-T1 [Rhinophrynus dorsalis]